MVFYYFLEPTAKILENDKKYGKMIDSTEEN